MPYINQRWLGGMLTNFETISKRVAKMKNLQRMRDSGEFEVMPKKEALLLSRELAKLERNLNGIRNLERLPDAVFILDTKKEDIAVTEANKLGISVVAVVDTNCDPDMIDFVIPGNDDAIRSGDLMCRVIADAVIEGKIMRSKKHPEAAAPKERTAEEEAERRSRRTAPARGGSSAGCAARPGVAAGQGRRAGRGPHPSRRPSPQPRPNPTSSRAASEVLRRPQHRSTEGERLMAEFTAKDVKALRDATGAGMMDAKKALTEADGDRDRAAQILREKGLSKVATLEDRENSQGAVAVARDGNKVALVELKSETDFSAKAEDFAGLAQQLADAVLAAVGVEAARRARHAKRSPRRKTSSSARSPRSKRLTATASTHTCTCRTVAAPTA